MDILNKVVSKFDYLDFKRVIGSHTLRSCESSFKFHLDILKINECEIVIKGWVFDKLLNESPSFIYLSLSNDEYYITTCKLIRPDVENVFSLKSNVLGFEIILNRPLPSGKIGLGFCSQNVEYYKDLN